MRNQVRLAPRDPYGRAPYPTPTYEGHPNQIILRAGWNTDIKIAGAIRDGCGKFTMERDHAFIGKMKIAQCLRMFESHIISATQV